VVTEAQMTQALDIIEAAITAEEQAISTIS
jgi:hypothetical protein